MLTFHNALAIFQALYKNSVSQKKSHVSYENLNLIIILLICLGSFHLPHFHMQDMV